MNYQLHHGDCLEIMPTLPAQSVDAIVCDPPYGITSCAWDSVIPFAPMWECIKHVIKPRGAVVLFGSQPFTSALVMSNPKWFRHEVIWHKQQPTGFLDAKRKPLKSHENVVIFCDGQSTYNPQGLVKVSIQSGRKNKAGNGCYGGVKPGEYVQDVGNYPRSVLGIDRVTHSQVHPTQKPVDLLAYLVQTYTNPGDTVLDFTCGSGSTGAACAETGRNFVGIELDETYFKIAQDRIESAYRKAQGLPRQGKPTDFADMPLFQ